MSLHKMLGIAAAVAIPISAVAVGGGIANASNPHIGAATDSIVCKNVTGTVSFSPKLRLTGYTSGSIHTTIHATVSGCTTRGAYRTNVTKGTVSGTLVGAVGTVAHPAGKCSGPEGSAPDVGRVTTTWSAIPADAPSVLNVRSVIPGGHPWRIPGTTPDLAPSGSFRGAAGTGSQDKAFAQLVVSSETYLSECDRDGVSSVAIETDTGPPAENALNLNS